MLSKLLSDAYYNNLSRINRDSYMKIILIQPVYRAILAIHMIKVCAEETTICFPFLSPLTTLDV